MKKQWPENPKSLVIKSTESAEGSGRAQLLRKCPLCPKTFTKASGLKVHISTHTQEKPYKCEHCDFRTASERSEQKHLERHHKRIKLQQCPLCSKAFHTKMDLQTHIRSHTKEKPFKCEYCDFRTACRQRHQRHLERTHDKSVWETRLKYKCELCPHRFHMPANLRQHMLTHSDHRNHFPCKFSECDFQAKSARTLQDHYNRSHSDKRPFACQLEGCEYRGKLKADIKQHMLRHSNDRPFHCAEANCGFRAKMRSVLNVHMKMMHGGVLHHCSSKDCSFKTRNLSFLKAHVLSRHEANGGFKCTLPNCNFRAVTKRGLTNHVANHIRRVAHSCDFPNCAYEAPKKSGLLKHARIHSDVRPFPCKVPGCNFRSKTEVVLKNHETTHNKAATLPCVVRGCPYLGRNKLMLNAHVRRHKIHPEYRACPQPGCSAFVKDTRALRQHQKLHNSKRPFACPLCPKFFVSRERLREHSFSHTREKPYNCVYCDFGSYHRTDLRKHYGNYHAGEKFHSGWPECTGIICKYCPFSGTTDVVLKHTVVFHLELTVNVGRIEIKFV